MTAELRGDGMSEEKRAIQEDEDVKYERLRYVESSPCMLYVLVTDRLRDARAFQRYTFSYLRAYAPYRGSLRIFQFYYVQKDLVGAFLNHVPKISKVSEFRSAVEEALKRVEGCEVVRKARVVAPREVKPEVWTFEASYEWRKMLRWSVKRRIEWLGDRFAYGEFSRSRWYCAVDHHSEMYCVRVGSGDVSVEFLKAVQNGLVDDEILDKVCKTYRIVREERGIEAFEDLEMVCILGKFTS